MLQNLLRKENLAGSDMAVNLEKKKVLGAISLFMLIARVSIDSFRGENVKMFHRHSILKSSLSYFQVKEANL